MKLFTIQRNVMSGQCKRALLRLQIRYTAIFFLCMFPGWAGSQIGLFVPRKKADGSGYSCTGFYFAPWFAPDIAVCRLPRWYQRIVRMLTLGQA